MNNFNLIISSVTGEAKMKFLYFFFKENLCNAASLKHITNKESHLINLHSTRMCKQVLCLKKCLFLYLFYRQVCISNINIFLCLHNIVQEPIYKKKISMMKAMKNFQIYQLKCLVCCVHLQENRNRHIPLFLNFAKV